LFDEATLIITQTVASIMTQISLWHDLIYREMNTSHSRTVLMLQPVKLEAQECFTPSFKLRKTRENAKYCGFRLSIALNTPYLLGLDR
jgi:hypothetical protein